MPASFPIPEVAPNDDGWGPGTASLPAHLADMPFAPFGKGDKIGRASDWTASAYQKYGGRFGQQNAGAAVFNFFHNEEEENFHVVDNRPVKTTKFGGPRRFPQNRQQGGRHGGRGDRDGGRGGGDRGGDRGGKKQEQRRPPWQSYGRDQQRNQYSSSIEIKPEWSLVEQIAFSSLVKLNANVVGEPEDVAKCGELEYYDKVYDRVTVKTGTTLEKTKRAFRNVTTSDDPVIRRLASEGKAKVFITDSILTTLMCVRSSKYSWDLIITKRNGQVFIDKSSEGTALNLLTVNETAPEEVPEEKDNINGVQQLSIEATTINQNFSQQVLAKSGAKYKFPDANPFVSPDDADEELASCAYRYRKFRLDASGDLDMLVRCEVDAVLNTGGPGSDVLLLSIKALNEFDMKAQDWRKKIESQPGAVLAFETKNNKNKIAKWTAQALLAGADMIKLGYVSRASPRDNTNHVILATQVCKPKDFAAQINLSMEHCWGIVKALVELVLRMDDGKFRLIKDPAKELLRLYALPPEEGAEGEGEDK